MGRIIEKTGFFGSKKIIYLEDEAEDISNRIVQDDNLLF